MKCVCSIYFSLSPANLIRRGTPYKKYSYEVLGVAGRFRYSDSEISKHFRESSGLRDNESRLYLILYLLNFLAERQTMHYWSLVAQISLSEYLGNIQGDNGCGGVYVCVCVCVGGGGGEGGSVSPDEKFTQSARVNLSSTSASSNCIRSILIDLRLRFHLYNLDTLGSSQPGGQRRLRTDWLLRSAGWFESLLGAHAIL